ncbi:1-deoxy-D-xylulose-5-phosphate synthase, partial [candidate division KSB1 bacterium]|nr:1-deoxy-D-xylulose-5-phosphate synthase [candidate division KSB1 bacterium]
VLPIGVSEVLQNGDDVAIIGVGPVLYQAIEAAKYFNNLSIKIINARYVKPLDREMLTRVAARYQLVITLEEGTVMGGLGSAVAEFFAACKAKNIELIRLGVPDYFIRHGSKDVLMREIGLDKEGIIKAIENSAAFPKMNKSSFLKKIL